MKMFNTIAEIEWKLFRNSKITSKSISETLECFPCRSHILKSVGKLGKTAISLIAPKTFFGTELIAFNKIETNLRRRQLVPPISAKTFQNAETKNRIFSTGTLEAEVSTSNALFCIGFREGATNWRPFVAFDLYTCHSNNRWNNSVFILFFGPFVRWLCMVYFNCQIRYINVWILGWIYKDFVVECEV